MDTDGEQMLGGLIAAHHATPMDDLPALLVAYAALAGFSQPLLYLADLQQQYLVPLPGQQAPDGSPLRRLRIDTTLAGRAYRALGLVSAASTGDPGPDEEDPDEACPGEGGPRRWWVVLLDGTDRMGVLAVTAPGGDDDTRRRAHWLASLLAVVIATKRSTSDTYAAVVRDRPMDLSAEVLWSLLPTKTLATDRIVVTAALEPAYQVGGDAFDYALTRDTLNLAIFDAMGHDLTAGLTSAIAIGAFRNHRLRGDGLRAVGEAIDTAIAEQFARTQFATGVLATLDLRTGALTWVNRGHPAPLLLRHGHVVAELAAEPDPPMGLRLAARQDPAHYQLQPGDRLLYYTDGIVEAKDPDGHEFGLDRFVDFITRHEAAQVSAPETLRRLVQALLQYQHGVLQDDATVMLVEWQPQAGAPLGPYTVTRRGRGRSLRRW
ncbi:PP2C family protein-serine/threonine phosphatase [Nonomuraea angiospora]|uniref:PP2C family protein-serine/threonine phosphatase n=1 Tax=Nonomuraea angiospora TaxID=46172 RepID=UPI00343CB76E